MGLLIKSQMVQPPPPSLSLSLFLLSREVDDKKQTCLAFVPTGLRFHPAVKTPNDPTNASAKTRKMAF